MLEIVKVILEVVGKALNPSEITKMRKEKKLRELGADLFLLYTHLNEILITGEEIIRSLEGYVSRMERHLTQGDDAYALTAGSWVKNKIVEQSFSLRKFGRTAERFANEMQILDADAYRKLQPLISDKMNVLWGLISVMDGGYLPMLGPTEADLLMLAEQKKEDPHGSTFGKLSRIGHDLRVSSISSKVDWDENIYKQIKEYLLTREPRKQLEEIRIVLQQIRASLEGNFSLQDVLLEVGDRRFNAG
jgi:hypothetical protein